MAEALSVWTLRVPLPGTWERTAERVEAQGWDGLLFTDSQNMTCDPFVALALCARATVRIGLGTGVTNPVTRHPAATATAIATIQEASKGRAVLGIGRGDSALFHIGREPAPLAEFRTFLERLQGYLRGDTVDLGGHESRLGWLQWATQPKVPVDVAATGPKVIALAAVLAERVTFTVGADPERVRWAIETARHARRAADLPPDGLSYGAYVNVAPHPDRSVARELIRGTVGTFAHFSGMAGRSGEGMAPEDLRVVSGIHAAYDRRRHTLGQAEHAQALEPGFIERFAVVGPPAECAERLRALVALGIRRFVVTGASADADREQARLSSRLFVEEVLPAIRG